MTVLSGIQKDALGEIFNIGMGRAADALSQMAGEEVLLSVPVIRLVSNGKVRQDKDE